MRRLWILLVVDGSSLLAAPEIYRSRLKCEKESLRAVSRLAATRVRSPAKEAGPGVHAVGRKRVITVPSTVGRVLRGDALHIALVLSGTGEVAVGPVIHRDKGASRSWVQSVAEEHGEERGAEKPGGDTVYRFRKKGRNLVAISTEAKVIAPFAALLDADEDEKTRRAIYEVELSVRYTHAVLATVQAEPGLSRTQLESRIDEDFPHIAAYHSAPVDLDWTLESVSENTSYSLKLQDPPETE